MNLSRSPVIFLGPTLNRAQARKLCDADYRPPAAMGDITRAACGKPEMIILVDGIFEDRPSVWHKEILWAMSNGIAVIGASSMGALRAAELSSFGMLGYGEVYEDYANGRLTDDDEVAVMHGPEETHWTPLTDAMVDIRYALNLAKSLHILEDGEAAHVADFCKAQFFKFRSLAGSLEAVLPETRTSQEIAGIKDWFNSQVIGVKEADCRSLLAGIDALASVAYARLRKTPTFIPTVYLTRLHSFGFHRSEQGATW